MDFGTLKVGEEARLNCTLKNKGRYEISFLFVIESIDDSKDFISSLSVIPNKGVLLPNERPTPIQVSFTSHKEISIRDKPILKCQVHLGTYRIHIFYLIYFFCKLKMTMKKYQIDN